jgi:chromatin assembly factor 1 subunit A
MPKAKRDDIVAAFLAIDSHFTKKAVNDALSSVAYRSGAGPWSLLEKKVTPAPIAVGTNAAVVEIAHESANEVADVAAESFPVAEPIVVDEPAPQETDTAPTETVADDKVKVENDGDDEYDGATPSAKKRKTATPSSAQLAKRAERERLAAEAKEAKLAAKQAERDAKQQQREQEKAEREAKRLAEREAKEAEKAEKAAAIAADKAEKAAAIAADKAEKAAAAAAEKAAKEAESAAKKAESEEKNAQRLAEKAARDAKQAAEAAKKEKQKLFMSNFVSKTVKPAVAAPLEQADDGPRFKPAQYSRETRFAQRTPLDAEVAARVDAALAAAAGSEGGGATLLRAFVERCGRSKSHFGNFVSSREHDRTPGHVMKLFRYSEDNRPPYRGTWSRVSTKVTARRPFARDEEHLDYDYDSDADWVADDQEAGENLSDADDAESDDGVDEDEEQGGFVVDDGYLSADEGLNEDGVRLADDDAAVAGARQKPRAPREHAARLTPVVVGPAVAPLASELQWRQLQRYRIVPHKPDPIRPLVVDAVEAAGDPLEALPPTAQASSSGAAADATSTASTADGAPNSRRSTVPENLLPELLKLMNGSALSKEAVVDMVRATHPALTRVSLERVLGEFCVKDKRNGVRGYFVKSEACAQHGIDEIIDTAPKTASAPKPKKRTPAESNIAAGGETTTPKKTKKRILLEAKTTLTSMLLSPESTHNANSGGANSAEGGGETAPNAVTGVVSSSSGKVALINDDDF